MREALPLQPACTQPLELADPGKALQGGNPSAEVLQQSPAAHPSMALRHEPDGQQESVSSPERRPRAGCRCVCARLWFQRAADRIHSRMTRPAGVRLQRLPKDRARPSSLGGIRGVRRSAAPFEPIGLPAMLDKWQRSDTPRAPPCEVREVFFGPSLEIMRTALLSVPKGNGMSPCRGTSRSLAPEAVPIRVVRNCGRSDEKYRTPGGSPAEISDNPKTGSGTGLH